MGRCDHKFVDSNTCSKCGESVDALNAQALESLGAVMSAARKAGIGTKPRPVVLNQRELHEALDVLLAQFLVDNPRKLPSRTTVMELLQWSHARLRP